MPIVKCHEREMSLLWTKINKQSKTIVSQAGIIEALAHTVDRLPDIALQNLKPEQEAPSAQG